MSIERTNTAKLWILSADNCTALFNMHSATVNTTALQASSKWTYSFCFDFLFAFLFVLNHMNAYEGRIVVNVSLSKIPSPLSPMSCYLLSKPSVDSWGNLPNQRAVVHHDLHLRYILPQCADFLNQRVIPAPCVHFSGHLPG